MANNFRVKIGEIGLLGYIRRLGILKWIGIPHFLISKGSMRMIWLHRVKTLVNFGPVSPGFNKGKRRTPFVDQLFSYVRLAAPLQDNAAISTEFCGVIITQFCFTYSLGGVSAMLRRL